MSIKIFDTHAHYDDEAFDLDRDELLNAVHKSGVERIVNIACSMKTSVAMPDFIKKFDFMYGTVGVHPDDIYELNENDMDTLKELSKNKDIIALGEIGLDYHYDDIDKGLQKKWFSRQIELALNLNLPVSIHSRDAAKDTLDVMKAEHARDTHGVMHCFGYGVDMAREYLNMGYYLGIGGVVTFKNGKKLKEVVEYAPIDQIVLETDCPYLSPEPFRGKRNDSGNLMYVANEIARIKGIDVEEVYETTYHNACVMYGLSERE